MTQMPSAIFLALDSHFLIKEMFREFSYVFSIAGA